MQSGGGRAGRASELLAALANDPKFQALAAYREPLSVARLLGVQHDEVAHSQCLALLLDSRRSSTAESIWRSLLRGELAAALGVSYAEIAARWKLHARTELDRVDVTVVACPAGGGRDVVLGIENKIHAGEQHRQVARYQESMSARFGHARKAIVFLTPTGRAPTTATAGHDVPVISRSYGHLADVLAAAANDAVAPSREQRVLAELIEHIQEDILGNDTIRDQVRALYAAHPDAIRLLAEYRPGLEDIRGSYLARLRAAHADIRDWVYPTRGSIREIKVRREAWTAARLPFTVMLHAYCVEHDPRPAVRLWVSEPDLQSHRKELAAWAARVSAANRFPDGVAVDPSFPVVTGWDHWHRVLSEPDHPENAVVGDLSFSDAVSKAAADRAIQLIELVEGTL